MNKHLTLSGLIILAAAACAAEAQPTSKPFTQVRSLPGERVATSAPATAVPAPPATAEPSSAGRSITLGEYACYGAGTRLLAGMGFLLKAGGKYADVDGERGGAFTSDASARTITFTGGFLDGQVGRNVTASGFSLSSTVTCELWK